MEHKLTKTNLSMSSTRQIGRTNEIEVRKKNQTEHLIRLFGDDGEHDKLDLAIQNQSPKQLFDSGLAITAALSIDRPKTKIILLAALTRTWRAVRLPDSRSWQNQDDLQSAIDDVIEVFPTLKIEEFGHVMKMIRRGEITMFGRFDTPTLIGALRDYEMNHTVVFRENKHHERIHDEMKVANTQRPSDQDKQRFSDFINQLNLPRPKKTLDEMGGSINLSENEIITLTKPFVEPNNNETDESI